MLSGTAISKKLVPTIGIGLSLWFRLQIMAAFKYPRPRKSPGIGCDIKILKDPLQIVKKKMLWLTPQGVGRNRESQKKSDKLCKTALLARKIPG